MGFLLFLINAFVQTFGITQPTPAGARRAARVLGWVLLAILPLLLIIGFRLVRIAWAR